MDSFAPRAGLSATATTTSATIELPVTVAEGMAAPRTLRVANIGQNTAFVMLGGTDVVAGPEAVAVPSHTAIFLVLGSATHLATIALAGAVGLNIVVGD